MNETVAFEYANSSTSELAIFCDKPFHHQFMCLKQIIYRKWIETKALLIRLDCILNLSYFPEAAHDPLAFDKCRYLLYRQGVLFN